MMCTFTVYIGQVQCELVMDGSKPVQSLTAINERLVNLLHLPQMHMLNAFLFLFHVSAFASLNHCLLSYNLALATIQATAILLNISTHCFGIVLNHTPSSHPFLISLLTMPISHYHNCIYSFNYCIQSRCFHALHHPTSNLT